MTLTSPPHDGTSADTAPGTPASVDRLPVAASAAVVAAGLALATYALVGFREPDLTVAGPSLAVAVAGALGTRIRPLLLAGLVPLGALVTIASPTVGFDLHRPGEAAYFVGSSAILLLSGLAAVLGVLAVLAPHVRGHRRVLLPGVVAGVALATAVGARTYVGETASRDLSGEATPAELASAPTIVLGGFAYGPNEIEVVDGRAVVRLDNADTVPHDLHVEALDLTVFVPPGRSAVAVIELEPGRTVPAWCTVGDHRSLGMTAVVTRRS